MSSRRVAAVALVAVLALAGCATFDPLVDTRIESEVKARLVGEKNANLTRIGVESREATVRLTGAVASDAHKQRAEELARAVTGVRRVVNALDVRPGPR
ncbi:MAG: BON domain-containing protein [Candidatus Rokubacteria bacterium]|nr:BON domain-containing protein [Candidatus Rokubacteria bacterium]